MSKSARVKALLRALEVQRLVRISRTPKHADLLTGFVVAVGKKWVLLELIADGGYFDGYVAFRIADVVDVCKDRSVAVALSRLQPEWPPRVPFDVDLDTIAGVIQAFGMDSRLLGIEKERERRAQWIGVLFEIDAKYVWLWEVKPNAKWHKQPLGYKLKAITLVAIGNRYKAGLTLIASTPPTVEVEN
jgi:hypothetical protein